MGLTDAASLVQEMEEKRLHEDGEITAFLIERGVIYRDQKIQVFKAMAEDPFYDHSFIQNHIMEMFSDADDFSELIIHLSAKDCQFSVGKLADAYKHDPIQTPRLYEKRISPARQRQEFVSRTSDIVVRI